MPPRSTTSRNLVIAFAVAGGLSLVAQLFVEVKPHFDVERWFGFAGLASFVGAIVAMVAACLLGMVLGCPSDEDET